VGKRNRTTSSRQAAARTRPHQEEVGFTVGGPNTVFSSGHSDGHEDNPLRLGPAA
jgi:predicted NUDIX family NTP pyrophosphohydrolase